MPLGKPLLAGRPPISGYGHERFRIGGLDHRGSLLILPDGVYPWAVSDPSQLSTDAFDAILSEGAPLGFLLLGTGPAQVFPASPLREAFANAGLGLEAMDTGAACRTYNVLLAEERIFAAALIALP
jgi:uncharacterized protein